MMPYPYVLPLREDLLEVVDARDRPLLLMPREEALRCKMPHRKVRVLLYDSSDRLLLVRPTLHEGFAPWWTLPGTRVQAGESREDAVLRILHDELDLTPLGIEICPLQEDSHANKTVFFIALLPAEGVKPVQGLCQTLLVDSDELQGLSAHFGDMLTRELTESVESGFLLRVMQLPRQLMYT